MMRKMHCGILQVMSSGKSKAKHKAESSSHDKFILDCFIEESGDDGEGNDDDECLSLVSTADTWINSIN